MKDFELIEIKNGKYEDWDGSVKFYKNDLLHNDNGPAIINNQNSKFWFINGERHREDGPAVEFSSGGKAWWINGRLIKSIDSEGKEIIYDN